MEGHSGSGSSLALHAFHSPSHSTEVDVEVSRRATHRNLSADSINRSDEHSGGQQLGPDCTPLLIPELDRPLLVELRPWQTVLYGFFQFGFSCAVVPIVVGRMTHSNSTL